MQDAMKVRVTLTLAEASEVHGAVFAQADRLHKAALGPVKVYRQRAERLEMLLDILRGAMAVAEYEQPARESHGGNSWDWDSEKFETMMGGAP